MLKESAAARRQKTRQRIPMSIWPFLCQQINVNPQKQRVNKQKDPLPQSLRMDQQSHRKAITPSTYTVIMSCTCWKLFTTVLRTEKILSH